MGIFRHSVSFSIFDDSKIMTNYVNMKVVLRTDRMLRRAPLPGGRLGSGCRGWGLLAFKPTIHTPSCHIILQAFDAALSAKPQRACGRINETLCRFLREKLDDLPTRPGWHRCGNRLARGVVCSVGRLPARGDARELRRVRMTRGERTTSTCRKTLHSD